MSNTNKSKQAVVVDMGAEGDAEQIKSVPVLTPQVFEVEDKRDVNEAVAEDLRDLLKSRTVKVSQVVGKGAMLDPSYHNKGVDYRAGGLLDVRWVRDDESHRTIAEARDWVLPESISPRLKNIRHNELILMVRLAEQSANRDKFVEQESRNFERQDFDKTPNVQAGLSEFNVTRPTKRAV